MKVLIVGGGGREHALAYKIAQSKHVEKIYCAPGNAGIREYAELVAIDAEDVNALLSFALENEIDLTVVGPEGPLSKGITDRFTDAGLRVFGATKKAAELESSKSFAKYIMNKYGVPTAKGKTFTDYDKAFIYLKEKGAPVVVKADGLAAGKGVLVCKTIDEATAALKLIMVDRAFGEAGDMVVIEECLVGEEASFLAFTDGKTVVPLPSSQDHKPVFDNDKGLNTGGMGAYSPAPVCDAYIRNRIINEVMKPVVKGMNAEGRPYKGVLYAGLMIDRDKINVLEFNCRFGDPEAQPLLMRVKNDLISVMEAVIDERLDEINLEIDSRPTVCVVMASGGYPQSYEKGFPIKGLDDVKGNDNVMVFHAGTSFKNGNIVNTGGRVLGVTAFGSDIADAIKNAYDAVSKISWNGVHYRIDIGKKALNRMSVKPMVGIVMGSDSDYPVMEGAIQVMKQFGIPYEVTITSAHRTPDTALEFARTAKERGLKVIIAGAGHAAHLAGAMAGNTTLPVIGVPIDSSALKGLDALLSTVQMPPGVPVATVSIGKPGAKNAGILAAQIIGATDEAIHDKLMKQKEDMKKGVIKKAKQMELY